LDNTPNNSTFESSIDFQKFLTKEQLLNQQIQTNKPSTDQHWEFKDTLAPTNTRKVSIPLANSWFGNSYVGLAVKLPIFAPDKSINLSKQLKNNSR
jgi:hypothetical protein